MLLRTVLTKSTTGVLSDKLEKKTNFQRNTGFQKHNQISIPKMQQILIIDPAQEIKFKGPTDVPMTSYVTLTNPSESGIFFKIKTTAPKRYCVRPNCGLIPPDSNTTVSITLQPFSGDPDTISRHKFMFQTTVAPAASEGVVDADIVWDNISAEMIMDSKLRCSFESSDTHFKKDSPTLPSDEECRLRTENDLLKEEVKRLRLSTQSETLVTSTELRHNFDPPTTTPLPLFVIAFILAFLGILVGKFIL